MLKSSEEISPTPGKSIKPISSLEEIKILVEQIYGLTCLSIEELNGYDDKNYKISINDETMAQNEYVVKIMNSLDSKKMPVIEAQTELMLFLCDNGITCPRPAMNHHGKYYSLEKLISGEHVVRLLEFIPGAILHKVPPTPRLFYQCGKYAASLDLVLKKFHHEAYDTHQSLWMLNSVPELSKFIFAIKDVYKTRILNEIIEQFQERVFSIRDQLDNGIIHGDFNEQNIVVEQINGDWNVKGILDFGDSQYSCYLYEIAIVVTYMIILDKNLDSAGFVIAGYSSVRQITDLEFSLLKICVAARICQSLILSAYSILLDPGNTYILTTFEGGWKMLHKLWSEPEDSLLERWKAIAENYDYVE